MKPAGNGKAEGSSASSAANSVQDEVARLGEMLGIEISASGSQLAGLTTDDVRTATRALQDLTSDVRQLRSALAPFAEIARRLGWDRHGRDSAELRRHVIEAPAPDVDPTAAYCLTVGAFWRAAHLLDGDVDDHHPAGSTFAPPKPKRWWRR
jgi:hypothetical protein